MTRDISQVGQVVSMNIQDKSCLDISTVIRGRVYLVVSMNIQDKRCLSISTVIRGRVYLVVDLVLWLHCYFVDLHIPRVKLCNVKLLYPSLQEIT